MENTKKRLNILQPLTNPTGNTQLRIRALLLIAIGVALLYAYQSDASDSTPSGYTATSVCTISATCVTNSRTKAARRVLVSSTATATNEQDSSIKASLQIELLCERVAKANRASKFKLIDADVSCETELTKK